MQALNTRVNAPAAANMQRADTTLAQHAVQSLLLWSRTTVRMRQVLATTLLYHTRFCGGKMQAEAVGGRASIDKRVEESKSSNVVQESKDFESILLSEVVKQLA